MEMGSLTLKFKCITHIQTVYILKQEVTGITAVEARIIFFMDNERIGKVNLNGSR